VANAHELNNKPGHGLFRRLRRFRLAWSQSRLGLRSAHRCQVDEQIPDELRRRKNDNLNPPSIAFQPAIATIIRNNLYEKDSVPIALGEHTLIAIRLDCADR
jgi:hypothetical protein